MPEEEEPEAGARVEQPAAAALALRREAFAAVGGFDAGFHPAWFEDVDLARRMKTAGLVLRYWPAAVFRHGLGSTVPRLGYGRFLWIYYRNLTRYLRKHHGPAWALAARAALVPGILIRLLLLPVRRPRRAESRGEAFTGLITVLAGALTGWRAPAPSPAKRGRAGEGVSGRHRSCKLPFQPLHLPPPPPIPCLLHQPPCPRHMPFQTVAVLPLSAEPRPFQVRVALVQAHRAPLGDLQRLGKVRLGSEEVAPEPPQGGPGQEATTNELLFA
jgi:hypothetical protein